MAKNPWEYTYETAKAPWERKYDSQEPKEDTGATGAFKSSLESIKGELGALGQDWSNGPSRS